MLIESIGWIGATLFAFCGAPQAIKTFRTKKVEDLSLAFLLMWLGGEICTTIYIVVPAWGTGSMQWPLLVNYTFNTIIVFYLIWAKHSYPKIRK